jgi:nitrite reductase/ring-hydroxylating ferredoxin subunit
MSQDQSSARYSACRVEELSDGDVLKLEPPGRPPVALYRLGESFYATDDTCSHGNASLADGYLDDDGVIECPFHAGTFDIRTGEPLSLPCVKPVGTYPVSIEDGVVFVDLDGRQSAAS